MITVSKVNTVLLQTARANISSVNENRCENLRILFDSGSQLSYISPSAKRKLQLETLDRKEIVLKTFGNSKQHKIMDQVRFAVKSSDNNLNIYVSAFVSDICYPVEEQLIDVAKEKYTHLRNIPLEDSNPENLPLSIDILIGAQDYWDFIGQNTIRGKTGPVAVSSKLGYILSGPMESNYTSRNTSTNVINTHFLKVESEFMGQ